jgi:hypothetical protein
MVAYSFQRRFVEPILYGSKRQTVRAHRARHARPGEQLQLYTGMRTRQCRLIAVGRCFTVEPIFLSMGGTVVLGTGTPRRRQVDCEAFARRDGFRDWDDLVAFWAEQHKGCFDFSGVLICWEPL